MLRAVMERCTTALRTDLRVRGLEWQEDEKDEHKKTIIGADKQTKAGPSLTKTDEQTSSRS